MVIAGRRSEGGESASKTFLQWSRQSKIAEERERSGEDNKDNKDNEDTKDNDNDKKDNEDNNANDNEDNEDNDNGHYNHQAMTLTEVPSDPFNFFGTDFTLIFIRIPN